MIVISPVGKREKGEDLVSFVHIKNVVKKYSNQISVDHLNLSIHEGEIFGFVRPQWGWEKHNDQNAKRPAQNRSR